MCIWACRSTSHLLWGSIQRGPDECQNNALFKAAAASVEAAEAVTAATSYSHRATAAFLVIVTHRRFYFVYSVRAFRSVIQTTTTANCGLQNQSRPLDDNRVSVWFGLLPNRFVEEKGTHTHAHTHTLMHFGGLSTV